MLSCKTTKIELVEAVYRTTECEKQIVQKVVDELFEQIKNSLSKGNVIELRGFGTFEPRLRKGRENARNPKTGEKLSSDSHYVVAFRSGKDLKESLLKLPVKENQ
ncbi:HU family DNA-binding protein [Treponema sp.]|uniref:HU family DNA-binding protein n=1 Tax=Treponema sp. TaxID=166 RepID=UPI00298E8AE0|nr:HU family DNA-binding protein [Treponema sp.]MCQ2242145.1 integration host factor subunit beta [Treponema sp.]